jgi:hypothetical protein
VARFTGSITGTTPEAKEGKQKENQSCITALNGSHGSHAHADIAKRRRLRAASGEEIFSRLVGSAGSGENGLAVALHDLQPVVDIGGMVGTRLDGDPKIAAQERSAQLNDIS